MRLVEGVAFVVGREIEVVETAVAAATGYRRAAAVQAHANLATHVALGVVDEGLE